MFHSHWDTISNWSVPLFSDFFKIKFQHNINFFFIIVDVFKYIHYFYRETNISNERVTVCWRLISMYYLFNYIKPYFTVLLRRWCYWNRWGSRWPGRPVHEWAEQSIQQKKISSSSKTHEAVRALFFTIQRKRNLIRKELDYSIHSSQREASSTERDIIHFKSFLSIFLSKGKKTGVRNRKVVSLEILTWCQNSSVHLLEYEITCLKFFTFVFLLFIYLM